MLIILHAMPKRNKHKSQMKTRNSYRRFALCMQKSGKKTLKT